MKFRGHDASTPSPGSSPATRHKLSVDATSPSELSPQSVFYSASSTFNEESSSLPVASYNYSHYSLHESGFSSYQSLGSSFHQQQISNTSSGSGGHNVSGIYLECSEGRHAVHTFNPEKVHAARCAVLLRQLLLQLSALVQEHAVYSPTMLFQFKPPPSAAVQEGSGTSSPSLFRRDSNSSRDSQDGTGGKRHNSSSSTLKFQET